MKKIKALLFVFIALFAFTLAVVRVSAVSIEETYDFDLSGVKVTNGNSQDVEAQSSANPERKTTMTISCLTTGNSTEWKEADSYLQVGSKIANFKLQLIFNTEADAIVEIDLGTNTSDVTYKIFDGETTTPTKTDSIAISNGGHRKQEFEFTGAGMHIIEFFSETGTGSGNSRIFSISMVTSYESSETFEQIAEAAINRIGTVEYTDESRSLIAAATAALGNADESQVSNYETYTEAVNAFNALVAEKKSAFTTAVEAIGTVTAESNTAVNAALDALDQLLETEKAEVSASIVDLRAAQSILFDILYDTFDKEVVASDLEISSFVETTQLGNTIFKAHSGVTIDKSNSTIKDGTQFTKRIKLNATAKVSDSQYVLSFDARTTGTLKIVCLSASTEAERQLNIYRGSESVGSVKAVKSVGDVEVQEFEIDQTGWHFIGSNNSGINILSIEFIPTSTPEPTNSVNFYQHADLVDGVEVVRYIGVVTGYTLEQIEGNFTVVLGCDLFENGTLDITEHFQIADRLTQNGETFTAEIDGETFEFGQKENVLYVVCVVAVANDGKGLTDQYAGHELTATLSVPVISFISTTSAYTVLGTQAE